jgi:transposase-like protein
MMAISFKGAHFPQDIILMGVRWYVAYPLSYRHVEELMEERGVSVDHATIQRWVVKYSPQMEEAFHRRKRPVWVSWRMDETYIKIKGQWYYLYRAVDKIFLSYLTPDPLSATERGRGPRCPPPKRAGVGSPAGLECGKIAKI